MSDESFGVKYFWLILLIMICTPSIITGIGFWIYDCMERNREEEKDDVVIRDNDDNVKV